LRQFLVTAEIAVAVVLVAGAALFLRSLGHLQSVDPGFRAEHVLAVSFDFTAGPFRGPGNQQQHFHDLLERVAALPGVRAAGAISEAPLARRRAADQPMTVEGRPLVPAAEAPHVVLHAVTPTYFAAMGTPLRKGRAFSEADAGDGKLVAIVNEAAARLLWHGEDPIGKRIGMGSRERFGYFRIPPRPGEPEWREVVGVVADVRSSGLDVAPLPEVFHSYRQHPWYEPTLVVRAERDPLALGAIIRRQAAAMSRRAVVTEVTTMARIVADSIAEPRYQARLIGLFSAMAVLLGMLGIYGVASYTVVQRTQEIGIRVALGATRWDVARLVMAGALRATVAGLVCGLIAYFVAARWISALLYGVRPADPLTLAATCAIFVLAMGAATYIPARRAAAVDPASALRE
jgi:putative ABC transport system permease protein